MKYLLYVCQFRPDTGPYLEKLEQERMSKERGDDTRDNRSFLGKYVSTILDIFISTFDFISFVLFCTLIFSLQILFFGWPTSKI